MCIKCFEYAPWSGKGEVMLGYRGYKKRLVSRINPSLLQKINLQNTWTSQLNNINQIKSKWNYLQKVSNGPASLSVARDRNVCALRLIKTKDVFHFSNIISDAGHEESIHTVRSPCFKGILL